ncbi:CPBP family intramembrane glutamic endopeptidase [Terriglobus saanensis]|uniref:Abortive infection protein n=1 Tax=Terriglobus saanensis (strain ATCC BAA-1853 / DSM 23119 / SP1PR4) TaxID=401053 RepID=E8V8R5_TERSS|nr:CPBP family intramembrane glutamic endopeptidase [Terriglobus saanensis]ADV84102.1 Abortive infection protein [Terriglobus saanensis SP1PR4]
MPEEMDPQNPPSALPIAETGEKTWYPPAEDDAASVPPEDSALRKIFYGKDGLRAGWSLLLFIAFVLLLGKAFNTVAHHFHHPVPRRDAPQPLSTLLITDGVNFLIVVFSAFLVSLIEKRRFSSYGLGSIRGRVAQFLVGSLWGGILLSALVVALRLTGHLVFDGRLLFGAQALHWGILWLIGFLLVGLFEEYFLRAFFQFTVARGIAGVSGALGMGERTRKILGFWLSALFFAFIFGLGHKVNPGESPVGLLAAGIVSLVFVFSLWRTGSLWWAVGFHAVWDWAESFFYGVGDSGLMAEQHLLASHPVGTPLMSGGLTGPEGSVYVFGILALTAVVIALTLPSQPGSPSQASAPRSEA